VPNSGSRSCLAVSLMVTISLNKGDILTILAARAKMTAAWSRLCAVEYNWLFTIASGPERWSNNKKADNVVLAFFLPKEMMALRVPCRLS